MSYRDKLIKVLEKKDYREIYLILLKWKPIWNKLKSSLKNTPCKTEDDFNDIIVDTLVVVFEQAVKGNFEYQSDAQLAKYLEKIGIQRCAQRNKKKRIKSVSTDPNELRERDDQIVDADKDQDIKEEFKIVADCLEQLGSPCKEIIKDKSYGYSDKEIAERYGLDSVGQAKEKVRYCRKKLTKCINKKNGNER